MRSGRSSGGHEVASLPRDLTVRSSRSVQRGVSSASCRSAEADRVAVRRWCRPGDGAARRIHPEVEAVVRGSGSGRCRDRGKPGWARVVIVQRTVGMNGSSTTAPRATRWPTHVVLDEAVAVDLEQGDGPEAADVPVARGVQGGGGPEAGGRQEVGLGEVDERPPAGRATRRWPRRRRPASAVHLEREAVARRRAAARPRGRARPTGRRRSPGRRPRGRAVGERDRDVARRHVEPWPRRAAAPASAWPRAPCRRRGRRPPRSRSPATPLASTVRDSTGVPCIDFTGNRHSSATVHTTTAGATLRSRVVRAVVQRVTAGVGRGRRRGGRRHRPRAARARRRDPRRRRRPTAAKLAGKLAHLRVFDDDAGVMNRSVLDAGGAVLVVSQFTLYGDTSKGRRPSWIAAARPEHGRAARRRRRRRAAGARRAGRDRPLPRRHGRRARQRRPGDRDPRGLRPRIGGGCTAHTPAATAASAGVSAAAELVPPAGGERRRAPARRGGQSPAATAQVRPVRSSTVPCSTARSLTPRCAARTVAAGRRRWPRSRSGPPAAPTARSRSPAAGSTPPAGPAPACR